MDGIQGDPLRRVEDTRDDRTELKAPPDPARMKRAEAGEGSDAPAAPAVTEGAAGAVGGAAAGAAAGTVTLGPIGTIVGAVAGALGGGWAGLAAGGNAVDYDDDHDARYRAHYESCEERLADVGYDQVRPGYQLGHAAACNPEYRGRAFALIEPELQRAWSDELRTQHGDWSTLRPWVQTAYERRTDMLHTDAAQSQVVLGDGTAEGVGDSPLQGVMFAELDLGGSGTQQRASFSDPLAPVSDDERTG